MSEVNFICTQGTLSYNGIAFPSAVRKSIECEIVQSENGLDSIYRKYTIRVEAYFIYNEAPNAFDDLNNVDQWAEHIRTTLAESRGLLIFEDQGFGENFRVSGRLGDESATQGIYQDLKGGPRPRVISWKPLVSNKAFLLVWQCEACVPMCDVATGSDGERLLDYSMSRDFKIANNGALTIVTRGFLERPMRAPAVINVAASDVFPTGSHNFLTAQSNSLQENLLTEEYLEPTSAGFYRNIETAANTTFTRLDFTVTDTEIESDNVFMPYMFNMDVKHKIASNLLEKDATKGAGLRSWSNTLSGTIVIPKGIPRVFAWMAFLSAFRSRVEYARDPANDDDTNFIFTNVEITEPLYGRSFDFSVSWILTSNLTELFTVSKMFEPVPAFLDEEDDPLSITDQWTQWRATTSRIRDPQGVLRATQGASLTVGESSLSQLALHFDTCDLAIPDADYKAHKVSFDPLADIAESALPTTESDKDGVQPYPDDISKSKSWIKYDNEFVVLRDTEILDYTRVADTAVSLYQDDIDDTLTAKQQRALDGFMLPHGSSDPFSATRTKEVIANGEDKFYIAMQGSAFRVGHTIPMPALLTVNGNSVYPVGRQMFRHKEIGGSTSQPVYKAAWQIVYAVDGGMSATDLLTNISTTGLKKDYS